MTGRRATLRRAISSTLALGWLAASAVARAQGANWREQYLPQVTTGPGSFAWSPDGKEVVYSMQGTLWVQYVGTTIATQITSGATYDLQPDWSPNGRSIVFSGYNGQSYDLTLVDVPTRERRVLVDDGAMNVDARWSPDGSRIAWVSNAFNGRWHVFVGKMVAGRLDSVVRVTEDHDSGLSRDGFGAFDHYLSPTWSPDGSELILVSNRGRRQGSGGLWRMDARPGAPMREIHFEETAWKMRPDWARDGKRVVFSSYLGRQWHQLAVTLSELSDPVPLSFGDYDATNARWSPDGTRIGFISNGAANTALWTVTVPGGRRARMDAVTRRYRDTTSRLIVTVIDSTTRRPMPARVSVRDSLGRYYAPDRRLRYTHDAVAGEGERFEYGYWHTTGVDTLIVPVGRYTVEVWRGPEWRTLKRAYTTRADRATPARLAIAPLQSPAASLRSRGWVGGDLHVHMNSGGVYKNTPQRLAAMARAEGLTVVENLVGGRGQRMSDIDTWTVSPLVNDPDLLIVNGQEIRTGLLGHTSLLGLRSYLVLPGYSGYQGTALAALYPSNAAVFDIAHEQGALTGYAHPLHSVPDLNALQDDVPYELPVDVANGKLDFLEVMGFSNHLITSDLWYKLLNCGFRIPAGAGTDAYANSARLRTPPGAVRVYAKAGARLTHRAFLDAVKAGRTMVTNAPLVSLTVNGREPGAELRLPLRRNTLTIRVSLASAVPVENLELVANGRVVARLGSTADTTFTYTVDKPTWLLARAWSSGPRLPVLDTYPFASTSPVYVTMGAIPPACGADAEYFLSWINLLGARVRGDNNWNTSAEREATLALITKAHEEFIRRR